MSRSQNLRHSVINQVIDGMVRGRIPPSFLSQSTLVKMYNISRTTVCHILNYLRKRGASTQVGDDYVVACKPDYNDGPAYTAVSMGEQSEVFEQAFFMMINQRQLRPGETFFELQLVWAAGVNPMIVREYLLKFGRYNLIQNGKRDQWSMKQSDQSYTEQLFELRGMFEIHPLQHFLSPSDHNPR